MPIIIGIGLLIGAIGAFYCLVRKGQDNIGGGPIPKREHVYEEE